MSFSILPDSQLQESMPFRIGFDFRNDPRRKTGRKSTFHYNERINATGKDTAKLFLFAMETSGSGPPRGIMTLDDHGGAAAFLRAVQNQILLYDTFCKEHQTISDYLEAKEIVSNDIATGKTWEVPVTKKMEHDHGFEICKTSVNPLLLFLHLDQGCFANTGYTPFASPITNSRSIYQDHVEPLVKEVESGDYALTAEDACIVPFDVCLDESNYEKTSIPYRCTLNRDKQSVDNVMGKTAVACVKRSIEVLSQKVSYEKATMILFF
jgi:hypothetical protein